MIIIDVDKNGELGGLVVYYVMIRAKLQVLDDKTVLSKFAILRATCCGAFVFHCSSSPFKSRLHCKISKPAAAR